MTLGNGRTPEPSGECHDAGVCKSWNDGYVTPAPASEALPEPWAGAFRVPPRRVTAFLSNYLASEIVIRNVESRSATTLCETPISRTSSEVAESSMVSSPSWKRTFPRKHWKDAGPSTVCSFISAPSRIATSVSRRWPSFTSVLAVRPDFDALAFSSCPSSSCSSKNARCRPLILCVFRYEGCFSSSIAFLPVVGGVSSVDRPPGR